MDEELKKQKQADATAQADMPAQTTTGGAAQTAGQERQARAPQMPDAGYSSPYDQQLQDLYKSITERKPFEYSADDDAMYQQYKDRYMQLGQQAMRDTMGQAAALTGGYGSSYGQAVGQQQYDQYMLGLNDRASELYAQAYQRYQDEGDRARQNYAMLGDLADRDYQQWGDDYARRVQDYTLGIDEANQRAQYGDFSGIEAIYGPDAAKTMLADWAAQNPQLAYQQGAITPDQYQNLIAGLPMNEGLDENGVRIGGVAAAGGGYNEGDWYSGNWYKATGTKHKEHNPSGQMFIGAGGTGIGGDPGMITAAWNAARQEGVSWSEFVKEANG